MAEETKQPSTPAPPPATPQPFSEPKPETTLLYCARCGRLETFLSSILGKRKESNNCPIDARPLKPISEYREDHPEHGR